MLLIISGCSPGRFAGKEKSAESFNGMPVRVFLDDGTGNYNYSIESPVKLFNENTPVAIVKKGNVLNFSIDGNRLNLKIADKIFSGDYFIVQPEGTGSLLRFNGKRYRGLLKFLNENGKVKVINSVLLDDYVKGVVPAEMPLGKGNQYFEALKAFAICVRTYAVNNLKGNGSSFDVYLDTRDQVYGGASVEKGISDKAVDDTRNIILGYQGKPAIVYYHSICGGHTEKASNVFHVPDLPYLRGVEDGDPPNCSIAPGFNWNVKFTEQQFIKRLSDAGLISNDNYSLENMEVTSRFESGRVNELSVQLIDKSGNEKTILINSNRIRYVLKPPDNSAILRSTLFNIFTDDEKNVTVKGKGYGHGVGLCQWGALHLSSEGKDFKYILSFYFPGTELMELR